MSELARMMTPIRVVDIQKGPYKSGLSYRTQLNAGFRKIADLTLAKICYSSILKYSLNEEEGTQHESKRKN